MGQVVISSRPFGGFQLEFVSIRRVKNHMTSFEFVVEITAYKLESKSCKNKFSTNESTQIYNVSCDL